MHNSYWYMQALWRIMIFFSIWMTLLWFYIVYTLRLRLDVHVFESKLGFFFNSYNIFNAEQSINKELKKLSHWSIKHRGGRKDSQFFFVSRWSVCLQPAFATIPKSPEKTNTTFRFILYVKFLHDKLLLTTAADWGSHVRLLPHHLHFPGFSVSLAKAVIKRAADYSAVPGDTH